MGQDTSTVFVQGSSLNFGDVATMVVALATILTLIFNVQLARKNYRLTVLQINRGDKAKVYATALAGLRAMFVAEAWYVQDKANQIMVGKGLGPESVRLTLLEVFASGNEIDLDKRPNDDANIAEVKSIEFHARVALIGSNEVSEAFMKCLQRYREYSKNLQDEFRKIKGKETKEDLDSIRHKSFETLIEIKEQVMSVEDLMRLELNVV